MTIIRTAAVCLLLSLSPIAVAQDASEAGKPLPQWVKGTLDIHQISTGRGNSAFMVLPDGTTLLVDAGAARDGQPFPDADVRPDASRGAGGWIVRYVERALAPGKPRIDYAFITHYHPDHMGQVTPATRTAASGAYKLTGVTEVGDAIPIGTLIDRGSSYLKPEEDEMWKNYRAFIAAQEKSRGMKHEETRVGRADQIVLLHDRAAFPSFEVRNVSANGVIWTGKGDATRTIFPPLDGLSDEDKPTENMSSAGLRISYGKFDYFTGGDIPGIPDPGFPEWHSVESAIAPAIGETDVHLVNHHGSISPASGVWLATLKSQVIIFPAWSTTHPSQDSLKRAMTKRLYPGTRDIFMTTLREPTKASIGARVGQLKADHGHIVVRVAAGGESFRVYVLDDLSDEAKVLSVHGPYAARD